ncbi:MAG: enoyl-CoA hydratase/isomerase family protein [Candidatus Lambdaproteobacteria bacterium]|nr:enoyl-CoA hydratase/isomerase family protein [Candidatus Lambdaproteobacteria bacterium]
MDYQQILFEVDAGVLTLTFNRPERLNAFTPRMRAELYDALDRADADDAIRAVIVTGSGRGFCAGADLSGRGGETFDRSKQTPEELRQRQGETPIPTRLLNCKKPLIAAINGPAVGIGITMTLPMDIRLASESARIGFVFTRRGILLEAGSSWFLPRIVGIAQAQEWIQTGRVFGAEEALRGRLVRSVHPDAELLPAARQIGREIAENTSAVAVALSRQLLWRSLAIGELPAAIEMERKGGAFMGQSADAREGIQAFLEKRPARFPLRPSGDMPDFYPWW